MFRRLIYYFLYCFVGALTIKFFQETHTILSWYHVFAFLGLAGIVFVIMVVNIFLFPNKYINQKPIDEEKNNEEDKEN